LVVIRAERVADYAAIRQVNQRAFGASVEADLVDFLRAANKVVVSFVARRGEQVVGHIMFSPITVARVPDSFRGVGLAPMSVLPEYQKQGIASQLVRAGLAACRTSGYDLVVLIGHVGYYPRFGFTRALDHGFENDYDATDAFMVLELRPGTLSTASGLVKFAPEFNDVAG
jgi:putative acetyltransferase